MNFDPQFRHEFRQRARHEHRRFHFHMPFRILFFVVMVFLIGAFVMLLWNALMPALFALHTITYWQSIGLIILVRMLVGTHAPRHPFARLGGRPAWREYEVWWRQSGRQAYEEFTNAHRAKSEEEEEQG